MLLLERYLHDKDVEKIKFLTPYSGLKNPYKVRDNENETSIRYLNNKNKHIL